ncbi:MAG: DNA-binding response regulator [Firmicutes bacterium]|nr:DNA-binding response regulator [Bacillota bacterium]
MAKTILLIDDDPEIIELVGKYLKREGYRNLFAGTAHDGLQLARREKPDLVILDVILPDADGMDVCRMLRSEMSAPILLVSAKGEDADKVLGLGLGADDYLTKPFSLNELIARVKAHLRREEHHLREAKTVDQIQCGPIEINLKSMDVFLDGTPLHLTLKEFELLAFLCLHVDQVFSREELYEKIWGNEAFGDSRTVMVHVSRLREKIEADPNKPQYLKTVWGSGYKLCRNR